MNLPQVPRNEITVDVIVHPEYAPIHGNVIASGDDVYDKEVADKVAEELQWNEWAWCMVEVRCLWRGLEQSDYLGGCSYKDEDDFKQGGYYENMIEQCAIAIDRMAWDIHLAVTD